MSMRTSSAALLLLALAACSQGESEAAAAGQGDELIECAVNGAPAFVRECAAERVEDGERVMLVVRHPDGGFRRFEVTDNGEGLATADGADTATILRSADGLDVAVGSDRYRFPATVESDERE